MLNILHATCVWDVCSVMQIEEKGPGGDPFILKMKKNFSAFQYNAQQKTAF